MPFSSMNGWVAIVTGCGQDDGIGAAIARALVEQGTSVLITSRAQTAETQDRLRKVAYQLRDSGGSVESMPADVTDEAACDAAVKYARSVFGRVDILVNNAGADHGADRQSISKVSASDWQRVINVNLTGAFFMSRACVDCMTEQGRGRILNISSIAALRGSANRAAYAASKAGLHGLTISLAAELASSGVTVNSLCPGSIISRRARSTASSSGDMNKALEAVARAVPVGRIGTPQDVAHAAMTLVSADAGYITGQILAVDGGFEACLAPISR